MTLAASITALAQLTLQDPRRAARALLGRNVPLSARTMGLLLVAVVSAMLASVQVGLQSEPVPQLIAEMTASPFRAAVVQWLILALSVMMIHWLGQSFGGTGTLPDALLVTVWLQVVMLGFQSLQLLAGLVSPALAALVGLTSLGVFLWLLTSFVAELHGFRSRGLVLVGVLGSGLGLGFVLAFLLILVLGPEAFIDV
ncbi:MAG TPA: YIP1 family protein [Tabrizicola sp.]|nr:YIP1 family protein [Tabrizicola sp.]